MNYEDRIADILKKYGEAPEHGESLGTAFPKLFNTLTSMDLLIEHFADCEGLSKDELDEMLSHLRRDCEVIETP